MKLQTVVFILLCLLWVAIPFGLWLEGRVKGEGEEEEEADDEEDL